MRDITNVGQTTAASALSLIQFAFPGLGQSSEVAADVAELVRHVRASFAPWLLEGVGSALDVRNRTISGALLIVPALPLGSIRNSYAGWDRYIRSSALVRVETLPTRALV